MCQLQMVQRGQQRVSIVRPCTSSYEKDIRYQPTENCRNRPEIPCERGGCLLHQSMAKSHAEGLVWRLERKQMIVQKIPVFCKHTWAHGVWNLNGPNGQVMKSNVPGYMCPRCGTLWKTNMINGIIEKMGNEPQVEIGFIEQKMQDAGDVLKRA